MIFNSYSNRFSLWCPRNEIQWKVTSDSMRCHTCSVTRFATAGLCLQQRNVKHNPVREIWKICVLHWSSFPLIMIGSCRFIPQVLLCLSNTLICETAFAEYTSIWKYLHIHENSFNMEENILIKSFISDTGFSTLITWKSASYNETCKITTTFVCCNIETERNIMVKNLTYINLRIEFFYSVMFDKHYRLYQ